VGQFEETVSFLPCQQHLKWFAFESHKEIENGARMDVSECGHRSAGSDLKLTHHSLIASHQKIIFGALKSLPSVVVREM
jgi:hypothetical protein